MAVSSTRRRFPTLLKSAAVRFALLYMMLFGVSAMALATFIWWETAGLLERQTSAAISADVQGLSEQWMQGGTPALISTIQARLAGNADDQAIYLLADQNYVTVIGNLPHWPTGVAMDRDWFELPVDSNGSRGIARIHRFDLPDGFHLLVGRDARVGVAMRRILTSAMLWAIIAVAALGGLGAVVVRGAFARALSGVFATAQAISAGDLSRRVPRDHRGDEFDTLAESINDMLDRIARLMSGVRSVSDAIAHDLRTPITRARMRLEDAALSARTEDDLHAAIDRATLDLDAVVNIFQALLRITELEVGARRSAFVLFDVVPLLRDMTEFYEAVAEESQVTIGLQTPAQAMLMGDRALIQQALANLIDNAVKFMPEGGRIELSMETGAELTITVADDGPGMSDADRRQATERFFRAESARTAPGYGLGLSLVQAVAGLHGGSLVLLDNAPGLRVQMRLSPGGEALAKAEPFALQYGFE